MAAAVAAFSLASLAWQDLAFRLLDAPDAASAAARDLVGVLLAAAIAAGASSIGQLVPVRHHFVIDGASILVVSGGRQARYSLSVVRARYAERPSIAVGDSSYAINDEDFQRLAGFLRLASPRGGSRPAAPMSHGRVGPRPSRHPSLA
ncbi:MAG TPA: hypothetical protein VNT60_02800 [Deinococcales bacterium]|nr:hypothetical protein [Deinococcales bacterium]